MSRVRVALVALLLTTGTVISLSVVRAAEPPETQILSVSPPIIDIAEQFGIGSSTTTKPIKVTNLSDRDASIRVQIQNFVAGGERGEPKLVQKGDPDYNEKLALSSIAQVPVTEFTLAPKQSREITVTLSVPSGTEPGGHYGVVQFLVTNVQAGQVSVRNSVGTLILFKVAGQLRETGQIITFAPVVASPETGKRRRVLIVDPIGAEPLLLQTRFRNTGNVHYKPEGTVRVTQLGGGSRKLTYRPENVLPGSTRAFEVEWQSLPLFALVKTTPTFQFGSSPSRTVSGDPAYLLIIPWRALLALLLVFLVGRYSRGRKTKGAKA